MQDTKPDTAPASSTDRVDGDVQSRLGHGLQPVAADEGIALVQGPTLTEQLVKIAAQAMRALNSSGVIVSWCDASGTWNHVGAGSFVEYVPAGEPAWLEGCTRADLFATPATDNLELPVGFPPGLAAVPLHGVDGLICGTLAAFDRSPSHRSPQLSRLKDYGSWADTELRVHALYVSQDHLLQSMADARSLALQDPLTRLWNRQAIYNLLNVEMLRAQRHQTSVGVIFADLDAFGRVNDRFGKAIGDQVIHGAAQVIGDAVRPYDMMGRYSGEEFLMLLPGCPKEVTIRVAERMRVAVSGRLIETDAGPVPITASFGIANSVSGSNMSPKAMLYAADRALQRAKHIGRDCIAEAQPEDYALETSA